MPPIPFDKSYHFMVFHHIPNSIGSRHDEIVITPYMCVLRRYWCSYDTDLSTKGVSNRSRHCEPRGILVQHPDTMRSNAISCLIAELLNTSASFDDSFLLFGVFWFLVLGDLNGVKVMFLFYKPFSFNHCQGLLILRLNSRFNNWKLIRRFLTRHNTTGITNTSAIHLPIKEKNKNCSSSWVFGINSICTVPQLSIS